MEVRLDAIETRQTEHARQISLVMSALTTMHTQGGLSLGSITSTMQDLEMAYEVSEGQLAELVRGLFGIATAMESYHNSSDRRASHFQAQLLHDLAAIASAPGATDGWTTTAINDVIHRLDVLTAGTQRNAACTEQASVAVRDAVVIAVAGMGVGCAFVFYRYDSVLPLIYAIAALIGVYLREIYPLFAATILALIWLTS